MSASPAQAPLGLACHPTARLGPIRGAERVELSERFYRGVFVGALAFAGLAAAAALALLPLRSGLAPEAAPTIALTACLALSAPLAMRRAGAIYLALRSDPRRELWLVLAAAALVAYPLRSELWWPSCALLMVVATVAPLKRVLAYCLCVLAVNMAAHLIAGDLDETPTVAITGLWVGFIFWSSTFALAPDRLASHIIRLQLAPDAPLAPPPLRVRAAVVSVGRDASPEPGPHPPPAPAPSTRLERLTFRQLQVIALLADGLRYREAAESLSISVRQVQRHASDAVARLGAANINELVALAVADGLGRPDAEAPPDPEPR